MAPMLLAQRSSCCARAPVSSSRLGRRQAIRVAATQREVDGPAPENGTVFYGGVSYTEAQVGGQTQLPQAGHGWGRAHVRSAGRAAQAAVKFVAHAGWRVGLVDSCHRIEIVPLCFTGCSGARRSTLAGSCAPSRWLRPLLRRLRQSSRSTVSGKCAHVSLPPCLGPAT